MTTRTDHNRPSWYKGSTGALLSNNWFKTYREVPCIHLYRSSGDDCVESALGAALNEIGFPVRVHDHAEWDQCYGECKTYQGPDCTYYTHNCDQCYNTFATEQWLIAHKERVHSAGIKVEAVAQATEGV